MTTGASIATVVIIVATIYWLDIQIAFERIVAGITTDRALTAGGLGAGLLFGDMAIKAAVGFVGGVGTLALGDVIDVSPQMFAVIVLLIIGYFVATGGE